MRTHRFSIAILAVGALAVAGCGSDDNNDSSSNGGGGSSKKSAPSTSAGAVTLAATEFKFSPSSPKVKQGTVSFTIKNDGQTVHALEVEGPGEESKTGDVQPGQSKTIKVNLSKDGKYEFYCPVDGHKQQGMKGEVTVGAGGSSSSSDASDDSGGSSGGGY